MTLHESIAVFLLIHSCYYFMQNRKEVEEDNKKNSDQTF